VNSVQYAIKDWAPTQKDEWEERAAILEFCAGQKRHNAELIAYQQIMKVMRERDKASLHG